MSYTGRKPFAAPSSDSAVRMPDSGPDVPLAAATAGSAARTSVGQPAQCGGLGGEGGALFASGSSPWTRRYQTSSKPRVCASSTAEYWR
jgi:hypothetical protein